MRRKICLFTPWYESQTNARQKELEFCLRENLKCSRLDELVLLCEGARPAVASSKIVIHSIPNRTTYRRAFQLAGGRNPRGLNILCNSDIFLDDSSIKLMLTYVNARTALVLTRWNWAKDESVFYDRRDSQDTWAWQGTVPPVVWGGFTLGRPGCDNRIAYELNKVYRVLNPSRQIKTYHVHGSNERTYDRQDRVSLPYYFPVIF